MKTVAIVVLWLKHEIFSLTDEIRLNLKIADQTIRFIWLITIFTIITRSVK